MLRVIKSNTLIEAKYRLTLEEQRVILYLVSLIEPEDANFQEYEISIKRFCELADLGSGTQYSKFKKISKSLISKVITIQEGEKTIIVSWLASSVYDNGNGVVKLSFSPYLKPYLLQLKQNFTSYKLLNVLYLKSIYSVRIFELLKQYEKLSFRQLELNKLKEILGVENVKSYQNYADFKRFVILPAYTELKEKCDIYFEFEEIKEGRRVAKIKFLIYQNDMGMKKDFCKEPSVPVTTETVEPPRAPTQTSASAPTQPVELAFITEKLSQKEQSAIWQAADGNVALIQNRYQVAKQQREIKNLVGFMIWAVQKPDEEFRKIASKGKNAFQNFKGRGIDFDELQRKEHDYLIKTLPTQSVEELQEERRQAKRERASLSI